MYGSQWELALQLIAVHKSCILYYKSCKKLYQYYKSCARLTVQWNDDKIIIIIVPSYTRKYHWFVAIGIVTRAVHA